MLALSVSPRKGVENRSRGCGPGAGGVVFGADLAYTRIGRGQ